MVKERDSEKGMKKLFSRLETIKKGDRENKSDLPARRVLPPWTLTSSGEITAKENRKHTNGKDDKKLIRADGRLEGGKKTHESVLFQGEPRYSQGLAW